MSKSINKVGVGIKEFFRKVIVGLKRRPHNIAILFLLVSFVVYSFNLTQISNTTALVGGKNMGLCSFVTMLFSTLSIVCFLNAFPKRKKPIIFMLVLLFLMMALVIFADISYYNAVENALTRETNTLVITEKNIFVLKAQNVLIIHIVLEAVSVLMIALIPVYGKLFRMINTSVKVEDNGEMEVVEFEE